MKTSADDCRKSSAEASQVYIIASNSIKNRQMKNKITAIAILTVSVLGISVLMLQKTIKNMSDETLIWVTDIQNGYEGYRDLVEVPEFKERVLKGTRQLPVYSGDVEVSPYAASKSITDNSNLDGGFFSTSVSSVAEVVSPQRRSSSRANSQQHTASIMPVLPKKSSMDGLIASNRVTQSEPMTTELAAPFTNSSAGMPGPQRMFGTNDNPPGEGAPVGEGAALLILLAAVYGFYNRLKR